MQGIFGSVRRSLHDESVVGTVDKINSRIRKSRISSKPSPPRASTAKDNVATIRWRKGELIGSGAFGRVYMGMNLDTGELLAVKEVLITASSASKDKAQAHVKGLEEEVKLLKNLSHPNIVRYLGTVREEDILNILLEFVPGGSISSLLGKFGSFPEAVISTYTKQLLQGLEYLHKNVIMHRDIKGANILVDNKGCIKVADFGASKQVVELATVSGAKSMKGTPYWMAPEVILQTGHSFSADIWSVGCTVIEMATGRPPWSQQYQEVAALFHIGTTKSHPPIPEHLSYEAKDFLLKCLQKEPNLRPTAFELLQHPFVTGEYAKSHHAFCTSVVVNSESPLPTSLENYQTTFSHGMTDACSTVRPTRLSESRHIWETNASDGDMCQFDDKDYLPVDEVKTSCVLMPDDFIKSFNPMCEPSDDWGCKLDGPLEPEHREMNLEIDQPCHGISGCCREVSSEGNILLFPSGPSLSEDDEELTESKIRVFLDEKAGELKKLQTPLYEEYYHIMGATCSPKFVERNHDEIALNYVKLPPKSSSPSQGPIGTPSPTVVAVNTLSPGSSSRCVSNVGSSSDPTSQDILSSPLNDQIGVIGEAQQEPSSPSASLSERLRKWKEELDEELERTREMKRQAGVGRKSVSPKDRALVRQRERTRFGSPGK